MKQELDAEKRYRVVLSSVSSLLTKFGYQRRAGVLWKDYGPLRTLIELQKGQKSSKNVVYFTVNLSIVIKELLDPEIEDLNKVKAHEGHLYWRIGDFMSPREDRWWKVDLQTDTASIAEDVCLVLSGQALPKFQQYSTVSNVVDLLKSDQHPPMPERVRRRLLDELERH